MKVKRILSTLLAAAIFVTSFICGVVPASAAGKYSVNVEVGVRLRDNSVSSLKFDIDGYTSDQFYKEQRNYDSWMKDKTSYIKIDFGDYYCYYENNKTDVDICGIYKAGEKKSSYECFGFANAKSFAIWTDSSNSKNDNKVLFDFFNGIKDTKTAKLIIRPTGQDETEYSVPVTVSGDLEYFERIKDKQTTEKDNTAQSGGNSKELVISDKEIASFAYDEQKNIGKVVLKESVKKIGMYAFSSSDITEIKIPDSVTEIGKSAFLRCESLKKVTLPKNITKIEESTFSGCTKLSAIVIPNGVKEIGEGAFYNCEGLTEVIIPDSVTYIGKSAFSRCENLKTVTLSKNITTIEESAFSSCGNLKTIVIPEGVTKIEKDAFDFCDNLKSAYIPDSVTSIHKDAFEFCDYLTIYGSSGSYAEKYAKENFITFKAGKAPTTSSSSSKPSAPANVKAAKSASGKAKVSWGKVDNADGYVVYMATSKNGTYSKIKTISKNTTLSATKSKLTAGKTYYFKVRAYKTVNGKKVYSSYSMIKSVKV